jgi:hypothetical protein
VEKYGRSREATGDKKCSAEKMQFTCGIARAEYRHTYNI